MMGFFKNPKLQFFTFTEVGKYYLGSYSVPQFLSYF